MESNDIGAQIRKELEALEIHVDGVVLFLFLCFLSTPLTLLFFAQLPTLSEHTTLVISSYLCVCVCVNVCFLHARRKKRRGDGAEAQRRLQRTKSLCRMSWHIFSLCKGTRLVWLPLPVLYPSSPHSSRPHHTLILLQCSLLVHHAVSMHVVLRFYGKPPSGDDDVLFHQMEMEFMGPDNRRILTR
jgi:hypothetical protein